MGSSTSEIVKCPVDDIASYIDGELSPCDEAILEAHLLTCGSCRTEVNAQKAFLFALTASLEAEREIPLPKNFTKTIVANAESRVTGLRLPSERFTAIFICVALLLFALFALGAETNLVWRAAGGVGEKAYAIGAFVFKFFFNISLSAAVVTRSLVSHIDAASVGVISAAVLIAVVLFVFPRPVPGGNGTR